MFRSHFDVHPSTSSGRTDKEGRSWSAGSNHTALAI